MERQLLGADETLMHQVVDTFASVGQSDLSWTEKIWISAHPKDGSVGLTLGVGKYTNRGIFDGFAGASRGNEQWTVRASRRLAPHPELMSVGPVAYEIVEPLRAVRFSLAPNPHVPVAFDVVVESEVPPVLEDHWPERSPDGYRLAHDVLRYHAAGVAYGWMELEGRRTELARDDWVGFRDHSWGVRPEIGGPLPGLAPDWNKTLLEDMLSTGGLSVLGFWCPMRLERSDGSVYGMLMSYMDSKAPGGRTTKFNGGEELPSGEVIRFASVTPELRYEDANRRFLGGVLHVVTVDGKERPLTITPVSTIGTGFHLGAGNYFGYRGHFHGQWRGELHVEGDHIPDTSLPEVAREIHQIRDTLVRVDDPVGGGTGFGNFETGAIGAHPEMGLTAAASFM